MQPFSAQVTFFKILIPRQGANVNLFHDEKAPLTVASSRGEYDMVVYLVQNGANYLYRDGLKVDT